MNLIALQNFAGNHPNVFSLFDTQTCPFYALDFCTELPVLEEKAQDEARLQQQTDAIQAELLADVGPTPTASSGGVGPTTASGDSVSVGPTAEPQTSDSIEPRTENNTTAKNSG